MKNKNYFGKTLGYRRFSDAMWKTERLLELGVVGIDEHVSGPIGGIIEKLSDVKGVPGPTPKNYKGQVDAKETDDGNIELSMDPRMAAFLKKLMLVDQTRHDELRFFLYSNIFVSVWGAFETYIQMLFEELLTKKPEMLKSKEAILLEDVISNRGNILEHLVERQVEAIGHFKIGDLLNYLKKKINFTLTPNETKQIKDIYFVRNVIAHKSGIIRDSQSTKIPRGVKVKSNEIVISEAYLKKTIKFIEKISTSIEKSVESKFYTNS